MEILLIFFESFWLALLLILAGLLILSVYVSRYFPFLGSFISGLYDSRHVLGFILILSGFITFLFPSQGPLILKHFFPSLIAVLIGVLLSLQWLVEYQLFFTDKKKMIWIGNVLIYLKFPLGSLSLCLGFIHLFAYKEILL